MAARKAGSAQRSAPGVHDRFRSRAARVRRRPWILATVAVAVLALIGGLIYLVGFSSVLAVEQVRAVHADEAELPEDLAADVIDRAAVPAGVPLVRVNTGSAGERILEDRRIAEVSVQRSWPNTVTLAVRPREPAIAVTVPREPARLADSEGVVYDEAGDDIPEGLPSVRVPPADLETTRVVGAVALTQALPPAWLQDISGLRLFDDGTLRFDLGEVRVEWGLPGQEAEKIVVLQALLAQDEIDIEGSESGGRITVNISAPSAPVVTGLPEDFEAD